MYTPNAGDDGMLLSRKWSLKIGKYNEIEYSNTVPICKVEMSATAVRDIGNGHIFLGKRGSLDLEFKRKDAK